MTQMKRSRRRNLNKMEKIVKKKTQERQPWVPQEEGAKDPVYNCTLAVIPPWRTYGKILDIGCNFGEFTNRMRIFGAKEIVGFDFSPSVIKYAKKTYPDINFFVGDICTVDFDNKFDLIMASGVLNFHWLNLKEYESIAKKISGWLNDDGYFVEQNNLDAMFGKKEKSFEIMEKYFDVVIHLDFYKHKSYTPEGMKGHFAKYRWVRLYEKKNVERIINTSNEDNNISFLKSVGNKLKSR